AANTLVPLTAESAAGASQLGWRDRFNLDRAGNSVAVAALVLMLAALAVVTMFLLRPHLRPPRWPTPGVILVACAGMAIAAYLAWVEITGRTAVCGPVGYCNTVQQSSYATLFGWLPIGVLGVAG